MLKNRHLISLLVLSIMVVGLSLLGGVGSSTLSVAVLDVGQGQCIVICTPNGRIIVVDCGSTDSRNGGRNASIIARNYLKSMGKSRIDIVVLSHPHDDHLNGLPDLLKKMPAKQVLDIGVPVASPDYNRLAEIINNTRPRYRVVSRDTSALIDKGVCLTVLHPEHIRNYPDLNENSMVMRFKYGKISFLIASDAGFLAECEMLSARLLVNSTVLVVGHHGSEMASSSEWLRAVSPEVAVISVGRRNTYGHPSKEVLLQLQRLKVKVYRTDKNGAVVFNTDGASLRVKTYCN